ncbi:MAG: hypothetical protein CL878_08375 [Dehalococcoidia bacterium]|nr:hypothetical protein [Dehalococcoidia bacterium]
MVGGLALIGDVNERLDLQLDDSEYDTIGGFILDRLGHIPARGEEVGADGQVFRVESLDGNRINRLRVMRSRVD